MSVFDFRQQSAARKWMYRALRSGPQGPVSNLSQLSASGGFNSTELTNMLLTAGNTDIPYTVLWNPIPGAATVIIEVTLAVEVTIVTIAATAALFQDTLRNLGLNSLMSPHAFVVAGPFDTGTTVVLSTTAVLRNEVPNTGVFNGSLRYARSNISAVASSRSVLISSANCNAYVTIS